MTFLNEQFEACGILRMKSLAHFWQLYDRQSLMRTIFCYISPLFLLFSVCAFNWTANLNDVASALKQGDSNRMSKYFDNLVEISLNDKSHSYSKSQAELVIRDFFSSNTVTDFQIVYKGNSAGMEYCMGKLHTQHGEFRTSFSLKYRGDRKLVQEISFDGGDHESFP